MDFREIHSLRDVPDRRMREHGPQPEFRVSVSLRLMDAQRLWIAARERLLAAPGSSEDIVEETIGPVEAPQIADCIALLCAPDRMPGCSVDDFWVDSLPGIPDLPLGPAN